MAAATLALGVIFGGGTLAAGHLGNVAEHRSLTPREAYAASQSFLLGQPGRRGPGRFSPIEEAVVERWSGSRWRVTGAADRLEAR